MKQVKNMEEPRLNIENIDIAEGRDIAELVEMWEGSLNIYFEKNELKNVSSFEELTNCILEKVDLENSDTNTSTLAFNKVIKLFSEMGITNKKEITQDTLLKDIMPWTKRIRIEKAFKERVSSQINLVSCSCLSVLIWLLIAFISLIGLFFNTKIGSIGLVLSTLMVFLTSKFSRSLDYIDMEALVEDLVSCDYLRMREDNTINYAELKSLIKGSFTDSFGLEEDEE